MIECPQEKASANIKEMEENIEQADSFKFCVHGANIDFFYSPFIHKLLKLFDTQLVRFGKTPDAGCSFIFFFFQHKSLFFLVKGIKSSSLAVAKVFGNSCLQQFESIADSEILNRCIFSSKYIYIIRYTYTRDRFTSCSSCGNLKYIVP